MTDDQSIVTAGGWCAPSSTLYDLDAADAGHTFLSFFAPAICPSTHPDSGAVQCTLVDRTDRHDDGHQAQATAWPVTDQEHARWTHDCPHPDPALAWATLVALGHDPDDPVPCHCGAIWSLYQPSCGDCGHPDGDPTWHRWPPEGGAWDGTLSVDRGGITYPRSDT